MFQDRAHGVAIERWSTPDQDQRKLESPWASFPLSPWRLPGVEMGGGAVGGVRKSIWGRVAGRAEKGSRLSGQRDPDLLLFSGVYPFSGVH